MAVRRRRRRRGVRRARHCPFGVVRRGRRKGKCLKHRRSRSARRRRRRR